AMRDLDRESAAAPQGVHFTITRDRATEIEDRLNMLYLNAAEGFLLVFLALWLFLNVKLSFWVAMGLPVSFLGGLFFMNWFGISLNMISTFSLLIALGLLMDDAIVIAENIAAHLARGETHLDAAVNGVTEVGRGVISSFITTLCVFVPLMFISGVLGRILYVIPATLIIVLSVSLFEAFFILPGHLAHSFTHGLPEPGRTRRRINAFIDHVRYDLVGRLVRFFLSWRYALLVGVAVLFAVSLTLFASGRLKFIVFPSVDGDTAVAKVQMPPGTPLSSSEQAATMLYRAALRANDRLKADQPDGRDLVTSVSVYFSTNSDVADSGPHLFTVYADLLQGDVRRTSMAEMLQAWRDEADVIPGAMNVTFEDMMSGPGGKAIEIRFSADDLSVLRLAAERLRARLADFSGVFDIGDDLTPGKPEVVMSMRPGALVLGLNATDIARQLRAAYQGEKADELQIGSENYEFNVRLIDSPETNLVNFDNFLLSAGDTFIPLSAVADISYQRSPSVIKRYNGRRTVTVSADIDSTRANAMEITTELSRNFITQLEAEFPGLTVTFGGQREATGETGGSIVWAFLIGVIGIFILLSLQFESYLEPVVIMATIPQAVIGAIWGHLFFGMDFNMQSLIGVVSIAGIVVNDSILMIEFIKLREKNGASPRESAQSASSDRFRAIMLTSITTIAGLLPILMERSLQAQMLIPLAISIVFGLVASTLLVLFVTPAMYTVVVDYREWRERARR
ncbi:MAG: efflux RND transporter permease subunit, partial [Planctomycetes bacterium]|nr:efflux RND transporter permease subunit [Planctomycetota bacterium]